MEKICVYVEDNPDALLLMPLLFPLVGMSLLCFKDSQNFMIRLKALASRPSLFMLDIHVPPLDGFELLKLLRADPEYRAVPVIALTASVMNEEVQQLRQAGFNGVLAKPVDMQAFPNFVERILAGERLWRIE
jgi:CheY-like chemotaxis protein